MSDLRGHILGRYRLLEPIGQGGMATVYKAHDTVKNRVVAIKILSPAMAQHPQFSERFRREAGVVKQLKHPNIVPVEDFGETGGYAYLVMPLIQSNLPDRLQEDPLNPSEAARLMNHITRALEFAHRQGVVHRDIKPSNILIDEKGNALLSDFGLAHINDASLSLTGSALLGTPAYISPEQARGDKVDARSDQYALGILLFQLVTGHVPFEADTPIAVLVKHINEPVPSPSRSNPNVTIPMDHVILKATAKNPDDRFDSVGEMNRMFQAALAHAVDPQANPPPRIDYKPSIEETQDLTVPEQEPVPSGPRFGRMAVLAALLLALLLACPIASTSILGFLENASSPVEGSSLSTEDLNSDELTALAATIEALAGQPTHTPLIQTVVVTNTVQITPTPTLTATATLTGTLTPTATLYVIPTSTKKPPVPPPPTATKKPKPKATSTTAPTLPPPPTSTPLPTQPPPPPPPPTSTPPPNPYP